MSQRWFTHASPTLFNAGTPRPQLSSCFLVCTKDDSMEGVYDTLKECAAISKSAGGIGSLFTVFEQPAAIFMELRGLPTALFQFCVCSMVLLVLLITGKARGI